MKFTHRNILFWWMLCVIYSIQFVRGEESVVSPPKRLDGKQEEPSPILKRSLPNHIEGPNQLLKQWLADAQYFLERDMTNPTEIDENMVEESRDSMKLTPKSKTLSENLNDRGEEVAHSPPKVIEPPKLLGPPKFERSSSVESSPDFDARQNPRTANANTRSEALAETPPKLSPPKLVDPPKMTRLRSELSGLQSIKRKDQNVVAPPKKAESYFENMPEVSLYERRATILLNTLEILLHKDRSRLARAYRVLNIDSDDVELPWERECSRGLEICNSYYPDCCDGYTCLRSMTDWDRRHGVRRCWPDDFGTDED